MNPRRSIRIAFFLNLCFAILEFFGGWFTGSVAIMSDAVHDLGDAAGIGAAYLLERTSTRAPDRTHTYGYRRASVLGSVLTNTILIVGSVLLIIHAITRLRHPQEIHTGGMLIFAVFGVIVNGIAAYVTRKGDSLNQQAVNLHMLEDVLGWVVVLIGALVMHVTGWLFLDSLMSIGVALFILWHALKNMRTVGAIFMARVPEGLDTETVADRVRSLPEVREVHHVHIWSLDGIRHLATLHVVTERPSPELKAVIRDTLADLGIHHATLELERPGEACAAPDCTAEVPGD